MHRVYKLQVCYYFACVVVWLFASGCTTLDQSAYVPKDIDLSKGIVVGTVFERAVFTPYGAYFYVQSPDGKRIVLSSGARTGRYSIINIPPKVPKGVGRPFALQLPPGKYQVVGWALDYGAANSFSLPPTHPIEFEVVAGKVSYLGRFDANRFFEIASIHDKFEEDVAHIKKSFPLNDVQISNNSINVKGWWLPNPAGKEIIERRKERGEESCEQCE
jgi:hypothetical protein